MLIRQRFLQRLTFLLQILSFIVANKFLNVAIERTSADVNLLITVLKCDRDLKLRQCKRAYLYEQKLPRCYIMRVTELPLTHACFTTYAIHSHHTVLCINVKKTYQFKLSVEDTE
jgi:hypothetical protein